MERTLEPGFWLFFALGLPSVFFLSMFLGRFFFRYAVSMRMVAIPDHRTSHSGAIPRGGGISFATSWLAVTLAGVAYGFVPWGSVCYMLPGALLMGLTGFVDDQRRLGVTPRLVAQLLAGVLLIAGLACQTSTNIEWREVAPGAVPGLLAGALAVAWSVNLFNFMDGIDTIASLEAVFVLSVGGAILIHSGGAVEGALAIMLAVAVAGFLKWNLTPAKMFMGDAGSYFLGFAISAFALGGEALHHMPVLVWMILYGTFWFDASVTLARRIIRNEKWIRPHRDHAYQRLTQHGWSHHKVSMANLGLNLILGVLAVLGYVYPRFLPTAFIVTVIILAVVYALIERLRPLHTR